MRTAAVDREVSAGVIRGAHDGEEITLESLGRERPAQLDDGVRTGYRGTVAGLRLDVEVLVRDGQVVVAGVRADVLRDHVAETVGLVRSGASA